jgi:hypothetical protein
MDDLLDASLIELDPYSAVALDQNARRQSFDLDFQIAPLQRRPLRIVICRRPKPCCFSPL